MPETLRRSCLPPAFPGDPQKGFLLLFAAVHNGTGRRKDLPAARLFLIYSVTEN